MQFNFSISLYNITTLNLSKLRKYCVENNWAFNIDFDANIVSGSTTANSTDIIAFLEQEGINNNPCIVQLIS